eukprot:1159829-Pelagomonas_calceolata.AAC.1
MAVISALAKAYVWLLAYVVDGLNGDLMSANGRVIIMARITCMCILGTLYRSEECKCMVS